ncbi:hypothetical protein HYQ43_04725 [Paracoccus pantotrophus]|uniref:Uncharacterized protein n=1 Tax=Paracoccus pantotrophus TaxID=82367 RepID=A0A7H9BQE9_PARPN|nr:hypothetical protein [Paracoccus pantotrophus]QLH13587.1 hypothetical protein HYQ43_04725 [Paracoccus pantotrophus]
MIDDLIERLRECAECKSSEAWGRLDGGQDLCIGAALATEAAAELARLRAEVERLRGVLRKRTEEADRAEAALADERAHADALAGALKEIADLPAGNAHAVGTAKQARHIAICARRQG